MTNALSAYLAKEIAKPVHPAITAMAKKIREQHANVLAVIAYGSALRDSSPENTLMDFYVLTQDLTGVSRKALSRVLCKLVPPNVYYAEADVNGKSYRAKYAVLPMETLAQKTKMETTNPYFWARFTQPMRLVFSKDEIAHKRLMQILIRAATTAKTEAHALAPNNTVFDQWVVLFQNTYTTELRPEDASRARLIVETQRQHFESMSELAPRLPIINNSWTLRRWKGKLLSMARLCKAAFTFQGGADYAAWKIKRHSGVDIEVKDWHRKHPLIASIVLLPKLLRKGALK
jgi:hypothetical protein